MPNCGHKGFCRWRREAAGVRDLLCTAEPHRQGSIPKLNITEVWHGKNLGVAG